MDPNGLSGAQRKILRDAFVDAFDEDALDMLLADELNKPPLGVLVNRGGNFEVTIFRLIQLSRRKGWLGQLVAAAEKSVPDNPLIAALPTSLRIGEVDGDPRLDGANLELTIRKRSGYVELAPWVARLGQMSRWLCRIEYPVPGGGRGYGTGFLVAADLVMTNYHVVERHASGKLDPTSLLCRFDYGVSATDGGLNPGSARGLAAQDWLVAWRPYSAFDPGDRGGVPATTELDYALLRLAEPVGTDSLNGAPRGSLPVFATPMRPVGKDVLFIVQHPQAEPLKLSVGEVREGAANGLRIRYDANTEPGSSGSPCLDSNLSLVALHHGGDPNWRAPEFNQGIPIEAIISDLAARGAARFWS